MPEKYKYMTPAEVIKDLKHELQEARWTIVSLMPERMQRVLRSYYACETRADTHGWEDRVSDELAAMAEVLPRTHSYYHTSDRAYCPLCGEGSAGPYDEGFALPEGLRRHLTGWGNARRCSVFKAVYDLARESWEEKFAATEEQEEVERSRRTSTRKQTETLYAIAPNRDALLIDEGCMPWSTPRNEDGVRWAEQRLIDLGFRVDTQGRVKSFIDEQPAYVVYADPRMSGQLSFSLYKRPLPKRSSHSRGNASHFHIPDRWKHNLPEKYRDRIADALR